MNSGDVDADGVIDLSDEIDNVKSEYINASCDINGDNELDACEVHDCVVISENAYRADYCPGYEAIICDCPFAMGEVCTEHWDCEMVA